MVYSSIFVGAAVYLSAAAQKYGEPIRD
jgi:hypothetical protein